MGWGRRGSDAICERDHRRYRGCRWPRASWYSYQSLEPYTRWDLSVELVGPVVLILHLHGWVDMGMLDPRPTFAYLATALRDKHPKLAYLHVIESRAPGGSDADTDADENNDFLREIWNSGEGGEERVFISAGGHTRDTALRAAEDKGGLVAFGRQYISNVSYCLFTF